MLNFLNNQPIMYTTVAGFYENGQIHFTESPPVQTKSKTKVFVTFIDDTSPKAIRKLGSWEGKYSISDDFNEPLDDLSIIRFNS